MTDYLEEFACIIRMVGPHDGYTSVGACQRAQVKTRDAIEEAISKTDFGDLKMFDIRVFSSEDIRFLRADVR